MISRRIWLLVLPILLTGSTTSGQVTSSEASFQVMVPQSLEDATLRENLCIDPKYLDSHSCTVMKRGKLYKTLKEKIPTFAQYGMSTVDENFPNTAFFGKPIYFCCGNKIIISALVDPRQMNIRQSDRELNSAKIWAKRYKALRNSPYYDKFKNNENVGVDVASKEAVDKIRRVKMKPEKKGNNPLMRFLQIVDEIRLDELEERLSKAKVVEENRSDVW